MITARNIVETARSFVGTPFRHQGRSPGVGLDCVGLVAKTAHQLGISDYDWTNYQRYASWASEFESHFSNNMDRVRITEIRPGHVVIFRQEQFPCHCGIVGERAGRGLSLIHAYILRRKVVEEDFTGEWTSGDRLMGAFAYRGVRY